MPNHFLLTGNELVADWPEPTLKRMDMQRKYRGDLDRYRNRPRYTCSPELLAMLKEGERYEEGGHFELEGHPGGGAVAVPVEKGEELKLKLIPADNKAVTRGSVYNELIHEVNKLRLENASLKQQLSKH